MTLDIDRWLEWSKNCKYLPENEFLLLCNYVMQILCSEPNILAVKSPVTICGDIHGQFYDLEELFRTGGQVPDCRYIFMGDFVDRGYYSLETITRLLVLKAKYPNDIYLIRGNHETRGITQSYGFYDECILKYGNSSSWKICCQLFDFLSVSALIDNSVFCVHGGLSPKVKSLNKIQTIRRNMEVPSNGAFCDLLWSDPDDIDQWEISPRGAGWLFGAKVTKEFLHTNGCTLICRAHQLVNEGIRFMFDENLVTVWSAPNYCYRCGNVASILEFASATNYVPKLFNAVADDARIIPEKITVPYFL